MDGAATKTEPSQGWTDPLFGTAFSNAKQNILPSKSTSTPSVSPTPPPQPSKSSGLVPGAIAGVVIGSIVAALLFILLLIFWRKKHSHPKQQITLLLENGEKPLPQAPCTGNYSYPNNSSNKLGPTVSNQSRGIHAVASPISPVSDSESESSRHSPSLPRYARSPTMPYGDRRPSNNHIASQQIGSPHRPEPAHTRSIHELPANSVADDLDRIGVLPKFSEHSMRSMREASLREGRTSPLFTQEKSTPI